MEPAAESIRASLLETLEFLASAEKQREFAAKVSYASYHDELACWWFDTFGEGEDEVLKMFSARELRILREFSRRFSGNLDCIADTRLPMNELHRRSEWQAVLADARAAYAALTGNSDVVPTA